MNSLMIVIQPQFPEFYRNLGQSLHELGHECHVMAFAWSLRTPRSAGDVFDFLRRGGFIYPGDPLIVAPLSGDWLAENCLSSGECYSD